MTIEKRSTVFIPFSLIDSSFRFGFGLEASFSEEIELATVLCLKNKQSYEVAHNRGFFTLVQLV